MSGILLTFGTFVLILLSLFLILVVLMQRGSTQGGLGAAFGGGMAESAFGADTGNILTKTTRWTALAFFVLSLGLYLGYMARTAPSEVDPNATEEGILPTFSTEETSTEQPAPTSDSDAEGPVTVEEVIEESEELASDGERAAEEAASEVEETAVEVTPEEPLLDTEESPQEQSAP